MKKVVVQIALFMMIISTGFSQVSFTAGSGDAELDITLSDMNERAKKDLVFFKKDLSVNFGIAISKLDELSVSFRMQPADLFMALKIAKLVSKPVDQVAESFKSNQGKGWGVIAKEMGIKPGSKEFHELKNGANGNNKKMKEKKEKKGNGKEKGNGGGKSKKKK